MKKKSSKSTPLDQELIAEEFVKMMNSPNIEHLDSDYIAYVTLGLCIGGLVREIGVNKVMNIIGAITSELLKKPLAEDL